MKIKEILELSYTKTIATIAKEHLPVGEKRARPILYSIGCKPNGKGQKGWTYAGDNPEILEKNFSEFVQKAKNKVKTSNSDSTNGTTRNRPNKIAIEYRSLEKATENSEKDDDSLKDEIQALIMGKKKEDFSRVYKGIWFDPDISDFLDNVPHGNKSEIVNKIMREYLVKNDLL